MCQEREIISDPLISFIIPVYNREGILERTVSSILNTTFDNYEIVLVDDASTDGSGAVCDRLATQHSQIRAIHLSVNGGVGNARNAGIGAARGAFLHFCDSDDAVDGEMLPQIAQRLRENPDMDLLSANHREQTKDGYHTVFILEKEEKRTVDQLLEEKPALLHLGAWRSFYSRRFLTEHQLRFPSIREHEDLYFNGLALLHAETVYTMPCAFYQYNRFIAENSLVAHYSADHSADGFDVCTAAFRAYLNAHEAGLPKVRAVDCFVYASAMLILGFVSLDTLSDWDHFREEPAEKPERIDLALSGRVGIRGCVATLWRQIALFAQQAMANQRNVYLAPAGSVSVSIARLLLETGIGICGFLDNSTKADNFHIISSAAGGRYPVKSFEGFFAENIREQSFILIAGSVNTSHSISRRLERSGWAFGNDYMAFIR
jgi:glycosyltransferase involved in cell wall biosynthesis